MMELHKNRTSEKQTNGVNLYKFHSDIPQDMNNLIGEYKELIADIVVIKKEDRGRSRQEQGQRLKTIKESLDELLLSDTDQKNILTLSHQDNTIIGNGQDSLVFDLGNGYVYKEGKESKPENVEYLIKKYTLLKRFLGEDIIPKSYFVYGESRDPVHMRGGMEKYKQFVNKSITIQKKVVGKDAQKMSNQEKLDPEFLKVLEKSHKKYILLKLFLNGIINDLGMKRKTLELQLDLGHISKIDNLHTENIDFVESKITSPNIMWDGKKVQFIDFGFGKWNEDKEKIYTQMMKEEVLTKWKALCESFFL